MKKILLIVLVLGIVVYSSFCVAWLSNHTEYSVSIVEVEIPNHEIKRDSLDVEHPFADRFYKKYSVKTTIEPASFPGFFKVTKDSTLVGGFAD